MGRSPRAEHRGTAHGTAMAEPLPMVVLPRAHWARDTWQRDASASITRYLPRVGSMLLRGFAVDEQAVQRLIEALAGRLLPHQHIAPFGRAAHGWSLVRCHGQAGESNLIDLRELPRALPDATRARLVDRGLLYRRELRGVGAQRWQDVFQSEHRDAVRAWCREHGGSFVWLDDGTLRLELRQPAVTRHASTGALCWSALTARVINSPAVTMHHADGSAIEPCFVADLARALACVRCTFVWEPGDLLVVDRSLTSSCELLEWEDSADLACMRIAVG